MPRTLRRFALPSALIGCAALALTSCAASPGAPVEVTYKLVATGTNTTEVHSLEYLEAPQGGGDSVTATVGTTRLQPAEGLDGNSWQVETTITSGRRAQLTAVPNAGATLSCAILFGGAEVSAAQGEPGQPVTCAAADVEG